MAAPPDSNDNCGSAITSLATIVIITLWPAFAWVIGPGVLFEAMATVLNVGTTLSKVTLLEPSTSISAVPAIPARLVKAILKVTAPPVSLA